MLFAKSDRPVTPSFLLVAALAAACGDDAAPAAHSAAGGAGGLDSTSGTGGVPSMGGLASGGVGSGAGGTGMAGASTGGAPGSGGAASGGTSSSGSPGSGGENATGGRMADGGSASENPDAGNSGPEAGALPGWTLVWSDEFEAPSGTGPDPAKWTRETGGHGWGNNELEYYTDRTDNAATDGSGSLLITAREESYEGRDYTSARLITRGHFEQLYGRIEARIQIPKGQGIWPAFWMLGNDIGDVSWPTCGEIDILENIGREPTLVHGTLHGPGYSGGNGIGASHSLPGNAPFADGYHVYAIEWETEVVRWYVDGTLYQTRTPADLPGGAEWVYDHPFFIILNVAVGGQWPGDPDETTVFPQTMRVDYVRVYER